MRRVRVVALSAVIVVWAGIGLVTAATALDPGPSASLSPGTRHTGCHVRGPLPDPACTPGARFTRATRAVVCTPGYARSVRDVSYAEKSAVYAEYGLHRHYNGSNGEVDHLVPLELGGSNDESNLWPEAAAAVYGSHQKDRLENQLHDHVCAGALALGSAQRLIAGDWVAAYRTLVH